MEDSPATLNSVAEALLKFCRQVETLHKEAAKLRARIAPREPETEPPSPFVEFKTGLKKPKATLENLHYVALIADKHLRAAEFDLSCIRSHLDQISNSSWSREEFKKYLVPEQQGPKKP